jgi:hypothetical protein
MNEDAYSGGAMVDGVNMHEMLVGGAKQSKKTYVNPNSYLRDIISMNHTVATQSSATDTLGSASDQSSMHVANGLQSGSPLNNALLGLLGNPSSLDSITGLDVSFTARDLDQIDFTLLRDRTQVFINKGERYLTDSESSGSNRIETHIAHTVTNMLSATLPYLGLIGCDFELSNMNSENRFIATVNSAQSLRGATVSANIADALESKLANEIGPTITLNGEQVVLVTGSLYIYGDAYINVFVYGHTEGPAVPHAIAVYADGLYDPLLSDDPHNVDVVSESLMTLMDDSVSANTELLYEDVSYEPEYANVAPGAQDHDEVNLVAVVGHDLFE